MTAPKIFRVSHAHGYGAGGWGHWCPGCGMLHVFPLNRPNIGTPDAPTFAGEHVVTWKGFGALVPPGACRYELRNGLLAFLSGTSHRLCGQVIALPVLPGHLIPTETK